jgi:hypothetical protein
MKKREFENKEQNGNEKYISKAIVGVLFWA